jgi:predicted nucleic acid-binding protein
MIVLLDTNILLDVLQDRKPFSDSAAHVWKLVETGELVGYVSAISFNNVFYVERKNVGFDRALANIKTLREVFQTVPPDDLVIDRALAVPGTDFEDGIQAAAAIRVAADYLVTRDKRDFGSMGVQSVTAVELVAILQP